MKVKLIVLICSILLFAAPLRTLASLEHYSFDFSSAINFSTIKNFFNNNESKIDTTVPDLNLNLKEEKLNKENIKSIGKTVATLAINISLATMQTFTRVLRVLLEVLRN